MNHKIYSAFRLLAIIFLSVFISEALVMFFLSSTLPGLDWKVALLDAFLLVALIFPAIYFFVCRPIIHYVKDRTQAMKESELLMKQNEMILRAAGEGILGLDSEGRVIFVNPAAEKMLGYEKMELIGTQHHEKVHHSREDGTLYPQEQCPIFAAYKDGEVHRGSDEMFWRKNGTGIPIEYSSTPIIEKGKIAGAVVTFRDLTERKRELDEIEARICYLESLWTLQRKAEDALRETETKFRTLFEDSRDAVYITTKKGKFVEFNQSALDLFGYTREEIFRMSSTDLYSDPDDRLRFQQLIEKDGYVKDFETRLRKKDGKEIYCIVSSTVRIDDEGNILGYHGIIHDLTERKKLEQQFLQAQKMEAIGQLAGGIAHDFNNVLTAIIGYSNLILETVKDAPVRDDVKQILSAAQKAGNLTQTLLAFSRKHIISPKPVNLNEIIKILGKLLSRLIGEDIEFSLKTADTNLTVIADAAQIEQVLMNLIANARDAMPGGGNLMISTDLARFDNEFITAHGFGKPGAYGLISVADTGHGMDDYTKERIFEPFFTTKEEGKGTGLGLAMVYSIVKQHEGYINVLSEPGKGTTFNIYLPLVTLTAEEVKPAEYTDTGRGIETILIAEDDIQVRKLSKKVLEKVGYTVLEAGDGLDAIRIFNEHKDKIRLLILDVIMPKKNGKECYQEIKKIKPDIRAVFTSGYSAGTLYQKGLLEEGMELVLKPVSPIELLRKVRESLDRSGKVRYP